MKNLMNCDCAGKWGTFSLTFLRVVLGAIFLAHGWQKYEGGVAGVTGFLGGLGFPSPEVFAVLLIAGEILAGVLLIVGAWTHWAAKLAGVIALVALLTVHLKNGFINPGGYEYILLILAASIMVMVHGGGKWSVDHKWFHKG